MYTHTRADVSGKGSLRTKSIRRDALPRPSGDRAPSVAEVNRRRPEELMPSDEYQPTLLRVLAVLRPGSCTVVVVPCTTCAWCLHVHHRQKSGAYGAVLLRGPAGGRGRSRTVRAAISRPAEVPPHPPTSSAQRPTGAVRPPPTAAQTPAERGAALDNALGASCSSCSCCHTHLSGALQRRRWDVHSFDWSYCSRIHVLYM